MPRGQPHPFKQGTAERVLFDRFTKANTKAQQLEEQAALSMTEARAERAAAGGYAEALSALGHGDKVRTQAALPDYSKLGEK